MARSSRAQRISLTVTFGVSTSPSKIRTTRSRTGTTWKTETFSAIGNETGNHVLGQGKGQPGDLSDLNAFTSTTTGYRFGGGTSTVAPLVTAIQPEAWFRANVDLPEYFSWW